MFLIFNHVAVNDDVLRIEVVVLSVALVALVVRAVSTGVIGLACSGVTVLKLRVVGGEFAVEDSNVFVVAERHSVGIEKTGSATFIPHKIVAPQLRLRHHELRGEHALAEEDDGGIVFGDAKVLAPERFEGYETIPLCVRVVLMEHFVGQVADDGIDGTVWDHLHSFEAVHEVDGVELEVCHGGDGSEWHSLLILTGRWPCGEPQERCCYSGSKVMYFSDSLAMSRA